MHLFLVISIEEKATAALVFTGFISPAIGFALKRYVDRWSTLGWGPFAILDQPHAGRASGPNRLDPAMQAAEVRQMLVAKAERQQRKGEAVLDVEGETGRLLAAAKPNALARIEEELRAEVRRLIVVRNERRARLGLQPLDVTAETERQLADLTT